MEYYLARKKALRMGDLLGIGLLTIEETLIFAHSDGLRLYEWWEKINVKSD